MTKPNDFKYERARRRAERHARQEEHAMQQSRSTKSCQFCGRLETHHIAGRMNDTEAVVDTCVHCHTTLSDAQQDYSPGLLSHKQPTTRKRRRITMLRGASNCLALLADKLYEVADELEFEGDEDNE